VGVIVGGAVLAFILVGLAVFFLLKRRAQEPAATSNNSAELKPQPQQSNYAAINVPPKEYDEGRLDSNDDQPAPSNYANVPAKSSEAEYNFGRFD
jgi:hypothetical protein